MSEVSEYINLIKCGDHTLNEIYLTDTAFIDSELNELIDCLFTYDNSISSISFDENQLADETGVQLARYLSVSSIIEFFNLCHNQFSEAVYLTVAAGLAVNSSLQTLLLYNNKYVNRTRINRAFTNALRLNPVRPAVSYWHLYTFELVDDYKRLKDAAEKSTPPSMLEFLLCVHLDTEKIKTKIH
jgi:hypothetical protein